MITLDELIEGGLTTETAKFTTPNYYHELFPEGYYPGTRVKIINYSIVRGVETVIVDHTKIKKGDIKSTDETYREYTGNELNDFRKERFLYWKESVFVLIPEEVWKEKLGTFAECCFFPYWIIEIKGLEKI